MIPTGRLRGLVFVTGRAWFNGRGGVASWEVVAISASRQAAVEHCEGPSHFVFEHELDEELPDQRSEPHGSVYPVDVVAGEVR